MNSSDSEHQLPKPDRTLLSPARTGLVAGRNGFGVVRGYPLGTAQDCSEWHVSGTAGEDDDARTWRRWLLTPAGGRGRPSSATTHRWQEPRGSRQVGHKASTSLCSLDLLYCPVDVGLAARLHKCSRVGVGEPPDGSQPEEGGTKYPPLRIRRKLFASRLPIQPRE
jgi:hypothetical protein